MTEPKNTIPLSKVVERIFEVEGIRIKLYGSVFDVLNHDKFYVTDYPYSYSTNSEETVADIKIKRIDPYISTIIFDIQKQFQPLLGR